MQVKAGSVGKQPSPFLVTFKDIDDRSVRFPLYQDQQLGFAPDVQALLRRRLLDDDRNTSFSELDQSLGRTYRDLRRVVTPREGESESSEASEFEDLFPNLY